MCDTELQTSRLSIYLSQRRRWMDVSAQRIEIDYICAVLSCSCIRPRNLVRAMYYACTCVHVEEVPHLLRPFVCMNFFCLLLSSGRKIPYSNPASLSTPDNLSLSVLFLPLGILMKECVRR